MKTQSGGTYHNIQWFFHKVIEKRRNRVSCPWVRVVRAKLCAWNGFPRSGVFRFRVLLLLLLLLLLRLRFLLQQRFGDRSPTSFSVVPESPANQKIVMPCETPKPCQSTSHDTRWLVQVVPRYLETFVVNDRLGLWVSFCVKPLAQSNPEFDTCSATAACVRKKVSKK